MRQFLILIFALVSGFAYGAEYSKEGKVADVLIRTGDEHYAILYISGLTDAGDCYTYRDHVAIAIPSDDEANARFAMVLALKMADKSVHVKINDTFKTSDGLCIVQDIRLSKSF